MSAPVKDDLNGWRLGDTMRDGLVCCERCGSHNINFSGWDIDKCLDCGHWRNRAEVSMFDQGVLPDA